MSNTPATESDSVRQRLREVALYGLAAQDDALLAEPWVAVEVINGAVIEHFLRHDCDCCAGVPAPVRFRPWRKRRSSPKIMKFVRFLERTGRVSTPGDLDDNLRILDEYIEQLRGDGYSDKTIRPYRSGCANLIVWLHLSRIRLRDLTPDLLGQFQKRQFICSIPGVFLGQRTHSPGIASVAEVRGFLKHLVEVDRIEPLERAPVAAALPECLEQFGTWLARNRDISAGSIHRYTSLIAAILPALGDDPDAYDARLIRRALFEHIEHRTRSHVRLLTTSMRMYLRFLVSEGRVAAALIAAVPTVPQWQLSTLPRYISTGDVERTIQSCGDDHAGVRDRAILLLLARLSELPRYISIDDVERVIGSCDTATPAGLRDRAMLLLLARLALRAGDVTNLRLGDVDWKNARLSVCGKSGREVALPLPQDVGDGLLDYIELTRPRLDEARVFLTVHAPHRPFASSAAIAQIVRRALGRAGVDNAHPRGASLMRHSAATPLCAPGHRWRLSAPSCDIARQTPRPFTQRSICPCFCRWRSRGSEMPDDHERASRALSRVQAASRLQAAQRGTHVARLGGPCHGPRRRIRQYRRDDRLGVRGDIARNHARQAIRCSLFRRLAARRGRASRDPSTGCCWPKDQAEVRPAFADARTDQSADGGCPVPTTGRFNHATYLPLHDRADGCCRSHYFVGDFSVYS